MSSLLKESKFSKSLSFELRLLCNASSTIRGIYSDATVLTFSPAFSLLRRFDALKKSNPIKVRLAPT
jgi:hypothetical protein